jgi:Skp family chaperone for outer membrane proteins
MNKPLIAALLLLLSPLLHAQDAPRRSPQQIAKARTERMTKDLGLSAEQATRVEAIFLRQAEWVEALRAQREAQERELQEVLTAEQYATWKQERQRRREQLRERWKEDRSAR